MTVPVRLALGGWVVQVSGPEPAATTLATVLAGLRVLGETPPALEIAISPDLESATGSVEMRPLWTIALPRSGWLGALVGHTIATLATLLTRLLFVHAGAVSVDGRGCMVIGESGAGKTSLIASLTRLGARYLSDDLALLDPGAGTIVPVTVPLAVKAWTARAAGALPPGREVASEGGTRYWLPDGVAADPVPAAAFVFLRPGGRVPRARALTRAGALLALARHTSSFSHRHRVEDAFTGFARILAAAQCVAVEGRSPAAFAPAMLVRLRAASP
ncbi:MAG TPA: hypothetical protein VEZ44_15870 [bacterium]|nr:hypothetical protein [bacterium]